MVVVCAGGNLRPSKKSSVRVLNNIPIKSNGKGGTDAYGALHLHGGVLPVQHGFAQRQSNANAVRPGVFALVKPLKDMGQVLFFDSAAIVGDPQLAIEDGLGAG